MGIVNLVEGAKGEKAAENYLIERGYKIIEKNYKCKLGEIDIIAKDKDYLVFVEVKERAYANFGAPSEAVTRTKQQKLIKTAMFYMLVKHYKDIDFRFDVIEVLDTKINHIENAFA